MKTHFPYDRVKGAIVAIAPLSYQAGKCILWAAHMQRSVSDEQGGTAGSCAGLEEEQPHS